MIYSIVHTTSYTYSQPVDSGRSTLHLAPRSIPGRQECRTFDLSCDPQPDTMACSTDTFGNACHSLHLTRPHRHLKICARSEVELFPRELVNPVLTPPIAHVRLAARERQDLLPFLAPSPRVETGDEFAEFAQPYLPPGEPVLDALMSLNRAIYRDFRYLPGSTHVHTRTSEVLAAGAGVCQDFAHLLIAACRSIGLPSRYVSGYLSPLMFHDDAEDPPCASHAWAAVWCGPAHGWIELDPTHDMAQPARHLVLCWGRDYSDVPPMQGVIHGGAGQSMQVDVRIRSLD